MSYDARPLNHELGLEFLLLYNFLYIFRDVLSNLNGILLKHSHLEVGLLDFLAPFGGIISSFDTDLVEILFFKFVIFNIFLIFAYEMHSCFLFSFLTPFIILKRLRLRIQL